MQIPAPAYLSFKQIYIYVFLEKIAALIYNL